MRPFQQRTISHEEWATPPAFFAALDAEFGFTLDACALPCNAKVPQFFSPNDDALSRDWPGTVWMNPPYGAEIPKWIAKARDESRKGATVVCLVPARTDTRWWHGVVIPYAAEVRFVKGRIKFVGAKHGAPFPCAVIVFKPDGRAHRIAQQTDLFANEA